MRRFRFHFAIIIPALFTIISAPAWSQDAPASPALIEMISRAAAKDDQKLLNQVVGLALETEPEAANALLDAAIRAAPAREKALLTKLMASKPDVMARVELDARVTPAERLTEIAAAEAAAPTPGFFDFSSWDGEVAVGGSYLTGNTEEQAISVGLALDRAVGDWEHHFSATGDYSRNAGVTTKERLLADYEAKWFFGERTFAFGLADFELDSFSEFDWRISEAAGLGYRVIEGERFTWDLEAGPGARHTKLATGELETEFIGFAQSDLGWKVNDRLDFSNQSSIFAGTDRTTLINTAAFTANINDSWSGRLGFYVKHDTSVPAGQEKTDTATRLSVIYNF